MSDNTSNSVVNDAIVAIDKAIDHFNSSGERIGGPTSQPVQGHGDRAKNQSGDRSVWRATRADISVNK